MNLFVCIFFNLLQVTLFGQSAGAQSTTTHMFNGKSNGLFRNVIIESSPFSIRYKTKQEALFLGDVIAELANCRGKYSIYHAISSVIINVIIIIVIIIIVIFITVIIIINIFSVASKNIVGSPYFYLVL